MRNPNFANELIQIWARKKFASTHKEGDTYELEFGTYTTGYCETCEDTVDCIWISRPREWRFTKLENISFTELLNEMLFPLEGIKEQEG